MARELNRLTALKVKKLTKPGKYADGAGLYLVVQANGSRSWVFRWRDRVSGNLRDKGLGPAWDVSLEQAREKAKACREQVRNGGDPIDDARAAIAAKRLEHAKRMTFGECCEKYIAAHKAGWKNAKHAEQWTNTLTTYCAPIWKLDVKDIDTDLVMRCLEPIWETKTETASRLRGRIESVLAWATVNKKRTGDNPAQWRNHLDKLLPKRSKVQKVENHPALPFDRMGDFMRALRKRVGYTARCLEFQILTAARPGEARGATWPEIDLDGAVWTIPAERMKADKEHRVALSPAAVALLKALPRIKGSPLLFPATRGGMLSDAATSKAVAAMHDTSIKAGGKGYLDPKLARVAVPHGFRSTFRDWAGDAGKHSREVIEHALAHQLKDKAEAAYARGDLFRLRVALMKDWAKHCQ